MATPIDAGDVRQAPRDDRRRSGVRRRAGRHLPRGGRPAGRGPDRRGHGRRHRRPGPAGPLAEVEQPEHRGARAGRVVPAARGGRPDRLVDEPVDRANEVKVRVRGGPGRAARGAPAALGWGQGLSRPSISSSPGPEPGPRYVAGLVQRREPTWHGLRSGAVSTTAGWFTKSTASGVSGGSGRNCMGHAASFRSGVGPGRIGRRIPAARSAAAMISRIDSASGPPSSNSWPAAAGSSRASATRRATSSMNTGASSWRPVFVTARTAAPGRSRGTGSARRPAARRSRSAG